MQVHRHGQACIRAPNKSAPVRPNILLEERWIRHAMAGRRACTVHGTFLQSSSFLSKTCSVLGARCGGWWLANTEVLRVDLLAGGVKSYCWVDQDNECRPFTQVTLMS